MKHWSRSVVAVFTMKCDILTRWKSYWKKRNLCSLRWCWCCKRTENSLSSGRDRHRPFATQNIILARTNGTCNMQYVIHTWKIFLFSFVLSCSSSKTAKFSISLLAATGFGASHILANMFHSDSVLCKCANFMSSVLVWNNLKSSEVSVECVMRMSLSFAFDVNCAT